MGISVEVEILDVCRIGAESGTIDGQCCHGRPKGPFSMQYLSTTFPFAISIVHNERHIT